MINENIKIKLKEILGEHVYNNFGVISPEVKMLFDAVSYLACQMRLLKRDVDDDVKEYIDIVLNKVPGILGGEDEEIIDLIEN